MDDAKAKDSGAGQKTDPPASWIREKLQEVAPSLAPLTAALLVSGLFCVYYFVYVREQRNYLTNRNFRFLAVLGEQIQGNIANHRSVLRYFVDEVDPPTPDLDHGRKKATSILELHRKKSPQDYDTPDAETELQEDYMRYLAPHLHFDGKEQKNGEKSGTTKLQVQRRNGRWQLRMTAWSKNWKYSGTVSFEELLQPFVGSLPFDDVLLSSQNGSIIYQMAKTGPQFTNLAELRRLEMPDKKPGDEKLAETKTFSPSKESAVSIQVEANQEWQKKPIHLEDIKVADTSYKLFLQPVLIDVLNETVTGADIPGASSSARTGEWVLCGLVPSATLEWQSLAISYRVVIWATVGFLIIGLSAPLLKLLLLNKRERLTLHECAVAGMSLVLLTGVMTFAALQGIYFHFNADPDEGRKLLTQISSDLALSIHQELRDMLTQLNAFCQAPLLIGKEGDLWKSAKEIYQLGVVKNPDEKPLIYPNFTNVFWTDDDGDQIIKWSPSDWATPMINIAQLDAFKNLQDPNLPDHPLFSLDDLPDSPFHLDSTLAPNKVDYFANLGMKTTDCNQQLQQLRSPRVRADILEGRVFLVAQPFSLIDPVLPLGYGFALVDASGKVLFHSNKTRNTRENFLEESDFNQELYSSVFARSESEPLEIKYLGQDYLVRVSKIPHLQRARWSLIVYRDLTHLRTLNLQTMTISSTLFLILMSGPILMAALLFLLQRPQYISERFWPNEARLSTYVYQTAVGTIFSALLLYRGFNGALEERLCSCAILTYSALLLFYWCFRLPTERNDKTDGSEPGSARIVMPAVFTAWFGVIVSRFERLAAVSPVISGCEIALSKIREAPGGLKKWFGHGTWPPGYRVFHALSAVSLLLLIGVLTPVVLFHASLQVERRLQVKHTQEREAADWKRRQALNELQAKPILERERTDWQAQASKPCDSTKKSYLVNGRRWDFTESDISECGTFRAQANNKPYEAWFRYLISYVQHDFNQVAAETQAMNSGEPLPEPTTPNYWKSELVSSGLVILIASWILWAAGNKLFLYAIVPGHAWKGNKKPKVMAA